MHPVDPFDLCALHKIFWSDLEAGRRRSHLQLLLGRPSEEQTADDAALTPTIQLLGLPSAPVISVVAASIALVRELKFDGVILNVEHKIAKADKFLQLCEEWRREVEAEARRTGRRCLLFTACFHEWPLPPLTL